MRPASEEELRKWDDLITQNGDGGNMLQSGPWAIFKQQWGWMERKFVDEKTATAVQVLLRKVPFAGTVAYIPKGPGCTSPSELGRIVHELVPLLPRSIVVQVEPEWNTSEGMKEALMAAGFIKSAFDVQLTHSTMVVELAGTMDDIRSRYRPKGRYNLGVARRHGVRIVLTDTPTSGEMDALDELVDITNDRAQYTVRPRGYLESSWKAFVAAGEGVLALAYYEEEPVAGAFVSVLGRKAWYKDGGSSRNHREVMAPYLLHDSIMEHLLQHGVASYDLGSVPTPDEVHEKHPLYGLYRFKKAFGARHDTYVGTWDFPVDGMRYALWRRACQKILSRLSVSLQHRSWY